MTSMKPHFHTVSLSRFLKDMDPTLSFPTASTLQIGCPFPSNKTLTVVNATGWIINKTMITDTLGNVYPSPAIWEIQRSIPLAIGDLPVGAAIRIETGYASSVPNVAIVHLLHLPDHTLMMEWMNTDENVLTFCNTVNTVETPNRSLNLNNGDSIPRETTMFIVSKENMGTVWMTGPLDLQPNKVSVTDPSNITFPIPNTGQWTQLMGANWFVLVGNANQHVVLTHSHGISIELTAR